MERWYYNESGEQRGPVSREQLQALLTSGKMPGDNLVWSESMTDWQPASSVPGLVDRSPYAPPATKEEPEAVADWSGYEPSGHQVRPWVRYWARTLDCLAFGMLIGVAAGLVYPEFAEMNDTLTGIVFIFAYNFIEPAMLSIFGTTPFKALLRVRVRNGDGSKLGYLPALRRTFSTWVFGQGLGIPLVALATCIHSYNRLTTRSITSWDQAGGFIVSHRDIQWWRWLLVVGVFVGFVFLIVAGSQA